MSKPFDIFLPCARKDYNKLSHVITAIRTNVNFGGTIHVCTPSGIEYISGIDCTGIVFHKDEDVLDIDNSKWKFRSSWMYQQCLKLFQQVTSDLYLVVDCDTIFNRPVKFFDGDKMIWHTGWAQFNKPYFDFQHKMIGIGKVCEESFISDTGFYDRSLIVNLLIEAGYDDFDDRFDFIEVAQAITTPTCYMCEQDLYASYCYINHKDRYTFKPLKMGGISAKIQTDPSILRWTREEIEDQIEKMSGVDCDTFSIHSWYNESPEQLKARERIV